jgi:hypothetical protein
MSAILTTVDPVLRVSDICRLLKISDSQFYVLKEQGFFDQHRLLVEVQPPIDRFPRYSGAPFVEFLNDKQQARIRRDMMRAIEASGLARASR